jgi:hypothetical protein
MADEIEPQDTKPEVVEYLIESEGPKVGDYLPSRDSGTPQIDLLEFLIEIHPHNWEQDLERIPILEGMEEAYIKLCQHGILILVMGEMADGMDDHLAHKLMFFYETKQATKYEIQRFELNLGLATAELRIEELLVKQHLMGAEREHAPLQTLILVKCTEDAHVDRLRGTGSAGTQKNLAGAVVQKQMGIVAMMSPEQYGKFRGKLHYQHWQPDVVEYLIRMEFPDASTSQRILSQLKAQIDRGMWGDRGDAAEVHGKLVEKLRNFKAKFPELLEELDVLPQANGLRQPLRPEAFLELPVGEQILIWYAVLTISHLQRVGIMAYECIMLRLLAEDEAPPTESAERTFSWKSPKPVEPLRLVDLWKQKRAYILQQCRIGQKTYGGRIKALAFQEMEVGRGLVEYLSIHNPFLIAQFYASLLASGLLLEDKMPDALHERFRDVLKEMVLYSPEEYGRVLPRYFENAYRSLSAAVGGPETSLVNLRTVQPAKPGGVLERIGRLLHELVIDDDTKIYVKLYCEDLLIRGEFEFLLKIIRVLRTAQEFDTAYWLIQLIHRSAMIRDQATKLLTDLMLRSNDPETFWKMLVQVNGKVQGTGAGERNIDPGTSALLSIMFKMLDQDYRVHLGLASSNWNYRYNALSYLFDNDGLIQQGRLQQFVRLFSKPIVWDLRHRTNGGTSSAGSDRLGRTLAHQLSKFVEMLGDTSAEAHAEENRIRFIGAFKSALDPKLRMTMQDYWRNSYRRWITIMNTADAPPKRKQQAESAAKHIRELNSIFTTSTPEN